MEITLSEPHILKMTHHDGETSVGGSQEWYEDKWQKASGCGPVAASNLIWYKTRPQGGKDRYVEIMKEMFTYITPSIRGVNTSAIFTGGIVGYGTDNGLQITPKVLEIRPKPFMRPGIGTVHSFILSALKSDAPVAFLNLSHGALEDLENWHWVTIIAFNNETGIAEISDYGKVLYIDITQWLDKSMLGGAMVYLAP